MYTFGGGSTLVCIPRHRPSVMILHRSRTEISEPGRRCVRLYDCGKVYAVVRNTIRKEEKIFTSVLRIQPELLLDVLSFCRREWVSGRIIRIPGGPHVASGKTRGPKKSVRLLPCEKQVNNRFRLLNVGGEPFCDETPCEAKSRNGSSHDCILRHRDLWTDKRRF